jgi:hypothetical protein
MATKRLKTNDKEKIKKLGKKIEDMILNKRSYKSLDAFALQFHDEITKPTLYDICKGQRDMKISTLIGLCRALDIDLTELLNGI